MRSAKLIRAPSTDQGTFGTFIADTGFHCRTGELPYRHNESDKSCIDKGIYLCKMLMSQHFGRMIYHLTDVPGREAVEIHNGNWCGDVDKGFRSDVEGCIIVGENVAELEGQMAVTNSLDTLKRLEEVMNEEPFWLTIVGRTP